jgi:RNA polymerase sigma factor (sigma-70 family)
VSYGVELCARRQLAVMESLAFARAPSPPAPAAVSTAAVLLPVLTKPEKPTLAALFEAEESALLHYALGIVGRRMVAEELVQETFLRLHQVWADVEQPRAWLYRSLRNLALNHLRARRDETELQEETAAAEAMLPADVLGRNEAVGHVRLLLAEMSPDDRALVRLKYHDGLKYDEIARRTGLSVGNVGYRLHHVLKGLADALRRAGIDGSQG